MQNILIVDDEKDIIEILSDILKDEEYNVFCATSIKETFFVLNKEPIDLIFLDIWLGKDNGIELLKKIKNDYFNIEIIMISGHANIDIAVDTIKLGAYSLIEKPFDLDKILSITIKALEKTKDNLKIKSKKNLIYDYIIGNSKAIKYTKELINQSAKSDLSVFIFGENGSGKELVAKEIHKLSERKDNAFIALNCASIPDALIESELFGYEKGAFTGAISLKKGRFELADGGTLFLDEIADLSLDAQAKLLRVLENKKISRLGSNKELDINVRIITATNKDLIKEIKNNNFRQDLYYRLYVFPIVNPPLRERKEDIEILSKYFIKTFINDNDLEQKFLNDKAIKELKKYNFPGNIRQLKNIIQRLIVMSDNQELSQELIKVTLESEEDLINDDIIKEFENYTLQQAKEEFEKMILKKSYLKNNKNLTKTASSLGLYPSNLSTKIKKYGLDNE